MKIIEKIKNRNNDAHSNPIPTIVAFGSSSTEGCFEISLNEDGTIFTKRDKKHAYHRYLADMIYELYPDTSVTVVNAGIAGDTTVDGLKRLERDVLSKNPDLVIMSLGGNDCGTRGLDALEEYGENLRTMLKRILATGSEILFWTPYCMCRRVSPEIKEPFLREVAADVAEKNNTGIYDAFADKSREVCRELSVKVCDLREKWLQMERAGVDTDAMLSNHINHATREYQAVVARYLFEAMTQD